MKSHVAIALLALLLACGAPLDELQRGLMAVVAGLSLLLVARRMPELIEGALRTLGFD